MIFGNIGKMGEMLKQAQKLKEELSKARYEAEAGGVRVVINGEMEIADLIIPPNVPVSRIEASVKEAVNRALREAKNDMTKKMTKITGGMQLPGM
jgi:hypothetical protein